MITIESNELTEFVRGFNKSNDKALQKEIKAFLKKEGKSLTKLTTQEAHQRVKKRSTGPKSYHERINTGKAYKYQGEVWAIRTYSTAPHAHLIEDGHVIKSHGKTVGSTTGKKVFETAQRQYDKKFFQNVDKFVDKVLLKGYGF